MTFTFGLHTLYFFTDTNNFIGDYKYIENYDLNLVVHLYDYTKENRDYLFGDSFIIDCPCNLVINIQNALIGYNEKSITIARDSSVINRANVLYGKINWFTIGNSMFNNEYAHFQYNFNQIQVISNQKT
jgi:hypothetical protein